MRVPTATSVCGASATPTHRSGLWLDLLPHCPQELSYLNFSVSAALLTRGAASAHQPAVETEDDARSGERPGATEGPYSPAPAVGWPASHSVRSSSLWKKSSNMDHLRRGAIETEASRRRCPHTAAAAGLGVRFGGSLLKPGLATSGRA